MFTDLSFYILAFISTSVAFVDARPIEHARVLYSGHGRPYLHVRTSVTNEQLARPNGIGASLLDGLGLVGDLGHIITLIPVHTTSTSPGQPIPTPTTVQGSTTTTPPPITPTLSNKTVSSEVVVMSTTSSSLPASVSKSPSTTISSADVPTLTTIPTPDNDGSRKYVVAHHMVGNTYPYTIEDWSEDIALAYASGIDGFALNCGIDEWQSARVADAYEAAKRSGLDFKLFISLDMASFPCGSPEDAHRLRKFVQPHLYHPNQLHYDNRAFVSTFAGETCTFGQSNVIEGWKSQFSKHPELDGKIYFVPAFFIDPKTFGEFSEVMDGDFNWNSGWPIKVTTAFAKDLVASLPDINIPIVNTNMRIANAASDPSLNDSSPAFRIGTVQSELRKFIGSMESDDEHLKGLEAVNLKGTSLQIRDGKVQKRKPVYMGAVSPWFFTHYGKDSYNKNWIYFSDQHLYSKRWESIVSNRNQFDIIQVLTWNDYGESDYVGPIKGAQPNSEAWVNGFDHTGWLEVTQYYATAYKTGVYPEIEKDKIIMWSRPHSSQAKTDDPIGQPDNFELCQDTVWVVVMTTSPSTIILSTSISKENATENTKQIEVPKGISNLEIPISPGGIMKGLIMRDGKVVVELVTSEEEFVFQGTPKNYNFNAFVVSAATL